MSTDVFAPGTVAVLAACTSLDLSMPCAGVGCGGVSGPIVMTTGHPAGCFIHRLCNHNGNLLGRAADRLTVIQYLGYRQGSDEGVARLPFFRDDKEDREKTLEYLSIMGMKELKNELFGNLSGGQQQRVSIARALAGEPNILMLDEPNTGIDVIGQEDFYHLLNGLRKKIDLTIIMASHDIGTIPTYVDEIACLNNTLHYHGNALGALNETILTELYGKSVDVLMHTDICEKCERLRRG